MYSKSASGKGFTRSQIITHENSKIKDVALAYDVPHLSILLEEFLQDRHYRDYHEIEHAVEGLARFARDNNRHATNFSQLFHQDKDYADLEQLRKGLSSRNLTDTFNKTKRSFGNSERNLNEKNLSRETMENIIPDIEAAGKHLDRANRMCTDDREHASIDDRCKKIMKTEELYKVNNLMELVRDAGVDRILDENLFDQGVLQVAARAKIFQNRGIEAFTLKDLAPPQPE